MIQLAMTRDITGAECKMLGVKKVNVEIFAAGISSTYDFTTHDHIYTSNSILPFGRVIFRSPDYKSIQSDTGNRLRIHELDCDRDYLTMLVLKSPQSIVYAFQSPNIKTVTDCWNKSAIRQSYLQDAHNSVNGTTQSFFDYKKRIHVDRANESTPEHAILTDLVDTYDRLLPKEILDQTQAALDSLLAHSSNEFMNFHNSVDWMVEAPY